MEDDISFFKFCCKYICARSWPANLVHAIFGIDDYILAPNAGEVLEGLINTLSTIKAKCVLMMYKDGKRWDEVCDGLNICVSELDEHISLGLRKLRHPSKSQQLIKYINFSN